MIPYSILSSANFIKLILYLTHGNEFFDSSFRGIQIWTMQAIKNLMITIIPLDYRKVMQYNDNLTGLSEDNAI